jgi:hypothetical protein
MMWKYNYFCEMKQRQITSGNSDTNTKYLHNVPDREHLKDGEGS